MSESSDSPVIPSSSEVGAEPDPWFTRRREVPSHSPHFLELVDAARAVQDSITGSNPPDDVVLAAVRLLEDVRALLDPWHLTPSSGGGRTTLKFLFGFNYALEQSGR